MNTVTEQSVYSTGYDTSSCKVGVVHLGYGAFHRAHQAVFLDDYMAQSGDLNWGIAAVNLRPEESAEFAKSAASKTGYILRAVAPDGAVSLRRVRPHLAFEDWSRDAATAEALLAQKDVHLVTITVTEGGYYGDAQGVLNPRDETIVAELSNGKKTSVYAYLTDALEARRVSLDLPITVACCDNIPQNGKKLHVNLIAYLELAGRLELRDWVAQNVTFPCSMVDRITPRSTAEIRQKIEAELGAETVAPIMAEAFTQWVLQDNFAGPMPALDRVGVTITEGVDAYEDAKIRILNGGHTCLTYLAALKGIETFDAAMRDPELRAHFTGYETTEVLPAITRKLPFDKAEYLAEITRRFGNRDIGDTVSRICTDGMAKFPIFIRPTLAGCFAQGIVPHFGIASIASWYVFAKLVEAGKMPTAYVEPSWTELVHLLADPTKDRFIHSEKLWGDLPKTYPEFALQLRVSIEEAEKKWLV
jgi:D-arabinitol 4-dehydrogenase